MSLGKIVNSLDQAKEAGLRGRSTASRSVSLGPDEHGIGAAASTRGATAGAEDRTTVGTEPQIKEEEEEEEGGDDEDDVVGRADGENGNSVEGTVIQNITTKEEPQDGDSLVSELLDDDGDTVMG